MCVQTGQQPASRHIEERCLVSTYIFIPVLCAPFFCCSPPCTYKITTGREVKCASKLYLQEPGKHWGALQAAKRISICQPDKLKQFTPTHDSWARYHDGITSALLGQDRLKERDHWAGSYGNAHPPTPNREVELGKEALASSPASLCYFPHFPLYCSSCKFLHP